MAFVSIRVSPLCTPGDQVNPQTPRTCLGERDLVVEHFPAFVRPLQVERRAQEISDPIQRLRYLRRATTATRSSRPGWRWAASLALAIAIVPLATHAISRKPVPLKKSAVAVRHPAAQTPVVWPVEHTDEYDLYSNGLRIENSLAISNQPRSYSLLSRGTESLGPLRSQPAGIVFHTTESDQAPFESSQKSALKRIGQELLAYVRNKRAYHFVIDRFGRVHRIVVESDSANHAGPSVWADSQWVYLGLNASFIGVAFEARTQAEQQPINDPQLHAAKALVEMLRGKYNLLAENCVTHSQVSVNPENLGIGYHTDWGTGFPFKEVGLPENYEIPNPALYLFGFDYDPTYINATGPDLWKGLALAEERRRESAAERGVTVAEYRKILQQRYKDAQSALQDRSAEQEK
jgi:hypothetical protein